MILVLHNVRMKLSNEKKKKTTKCDKRIFTSDVGTTQYEDGTVKCEEKK